MARSVNERMNNLTREALELLASDPAIMTAMGVFVLSDEGTVFTGFRNGSTASKGDALILDLRALMDECDRLPKSPAKWCVVS